MWFGSSSFPVLTLILATTKKQLCREEQVFVTKSSFLFKSSNVLFDKSSSTVQKWSLNHAACNSSEIKKIVPWNNSCPLPEYFELILENEYWIKIKIDQIAALCVACRPNHESPSILPNFFGAPCLSIQK